MSEGPPRYQRLRTQTETEGCHDGWPALWVVGNTGGSIAHYEGKPFKVVCASTRGHSAPTWQDAAYIALKETGWLPASCLTAHNKRPLAVSWARYG